jgi:pyruvate/2-oxoglutarate dehydrogenase complex dihydrolipoamide dehydrogenase (E3) component/uncharacterized membrane protein YdjX (TVP38/TMEM64 family)
MTPRPRIAIWLGAALAALAVVLLYRHFDLGSVLTFERLKESRDGLASLYRNRPGPTLLGFFAAYVAVAALSIPGALVLTLAAGAMFGLWIGLLVVSFASSLGALLAFLMARYVLRDTVQSRFGKLFAAIDEGVQRDGTFYLLTLRLVPAFPFWAINLLMGLTRISAGRFYVVSQVGMLAGTVVYVNAGTQLAAIGSPRDVLSPGVLWSLVLLGIFPLMAKFVVGALKSRKVYGHWKKPSRFDRNLVVIGAGAGGLVSAYIAATVRAKVTLVEGHKMGGDCLNYGCVPSKALIRSARLAHQIEEASGLGLKNASAEVDFGAVMARVHSVIDAIEPNDSVARYTALGVEVLQGHARIASPWTVEVTDAGGGRRTLTSRSIVIAAGASPLVPRIPGLDEVGFLTSDTVWGLKELPARLVVLGGGPVGCELAQSFARLGAAVTQVEMTNSVMGREDPEVAAMVDASLRADGVNLLTGHEAVRCERDGSVKRLIARSGDREIAVEFDQLLCAVGRSPRTQGYGLEELGIALTAKKTIETNAFLQTTYPNIYAVGDVAGPFQFTHTAAHQAWYAAVNALFGRFRMFKADYSVIPWATFTDPEVARVGLSETEAREQGVAYEITKHGFDALDRAVADGTAHGFVKVLTVPGKDRILGVTIVGEHAGDLLAEFVLAMKHGLGLNKILGTIHTYPTMAEANKYAAGNWKRAHAPQKLLEWVGRYHAWERA